MYTIAIYLTNCLLFAITQGTEEEQMEYCFKIYDINNDGYITREEMMTLMKNCLIR